MQPEPFIPHLSEATLSDLHSRLLATRWPAVIGGDDWLYGVPAGWLKDMISYWATAWDWPGVVAEMNRYDHIQVEIDGVPVHALRSPGTGVDPIPLILTHGWPWTFWDFRHLIDPLTDPATHGAPDAPSFDVVVPSLPGFGFSTPLSVPGIDVSAVADRWNQLMTDLLGYDRYAAHGGDWGALVTAHLGHAHADRLIGVHLGLPVGRGLVRTEIPDEMWSPDEAWMRDRSAEAMPLIKSHLAVHSTDPQTLAYALADSPVGTAAWLWERRRNWSDCGGDVESVFDRDDLCTTAALYWCTGAITSSLRIYFEHFNKPWPLVHDRTPVIEAPTAYAVFPKDVVMLPRRVVEATTNLVRWTVMPVGGHFGAAEQPELVVEDIRATFAALR